MKLLKRFMLGFFVLYIMFLSNNTAKATVGSGFKQVVAGQGGSMALNNDGHVWVWGNRIHGAGDVAISEAEKAVPRQVYGLDNVKALLDDKGQYALKNDGTVWKIPMHTVKNTYKVFSSGEIDNAKRIVDNNTISFAVKEDGSVYTSEQGDDDEYYDRMLPCFVHEMAHQIYAPDHYHETIMVEDSDGKEVEKCLRLQDNGDNICSECGKTPRPQFCIMNSGWTLDSENGYFCDESIVNGVVQHNSGCISDMKKGLLATH